MKSIDHTTIVIVFFFLNICDTSYDERVKERRAGGRDESMLFILANK